MSDALQQVLAHPTGRIALPLFLICCGAWLRVDGLRMLASLPRWRVPKLAPDRVWRRA